MRDEATSSEWLHYTGECIVGPRAGRSLEMVATTAMTWKAFRENYPAGTTIPPAREWWRRLTGRVLGGRRGGFLPKLFRDTMGETDARLPDGELGLGVFVGARSLVARKAATDTRFYPFAAVRAARLIRDEVGGVPIVVHYGETTDTPIALIAELDGAPVALELAADGMLRDPASGSIFDAVGRCRQGPLDGKRLPLAPSVWTRWYGFSQTYPGTSIWVPSPSR